MRGGRLSSTREDVANFTSSIKDDLLLSEAVININRAHVMMLMEENIINQFTGVALLKALTSLLDTSFSPSSEDIHMAIEETVIQKTGEEIGQFADGTREFFSDAWNPPRARKAWWNKAPKSFASQPKKPFFKWPGGQEPNQVQPPPMPRTARQYQGGQPRHRFK